MIKFINNTTKKQDKYFTPGNLHNNRLYQYVGDKDFKNLKVNDIIYITSNNDEDDQHGIFYLVIINRCGWNGIQPVNISNDEHLKFIELPYDLTMTMENSCD